VTHTCCLRAQLALDQPRFNRGWSDEDTAMPQHVQYCGGEGEGAGLEVRASGTRLVQCCGRATQQRVNGRVGGWAGESVSEWASERVGE
jgi:hypothetical protein